MESGFLPRTRFQMLLDTLHQAGYRCIAPQVRDGAIVYDTLTRAEDFPVGMRDRQSPGAYRLERIDSPRFFSWANGPQALKPFVFAPQEPLWRSERTADAAIRFSEINPAPEPLAVIGVRACDLMCGPQGMMQVAVDHLFERGVPGGSIYLNMERNMHCAVGLCGHCQYGGKFVCQDGPVFSYSEVKPLFGVRGF